MAAFQDGPANAGEPSESKKIGKSVTAMSVCEFSSEDENNNNNNNNNDDRNSNRSPTSSIGHRHRRSLQSESLDFSPVRHIASSFRIRSARRQNGKFVGYATIPLAEEEACGGTLVGDSSDDEQYVVEEDTLISQCPRKRKRKCVIFTLVGCGTLLIALIVLNVLLFLSHTSYSSIPDPDEIFKNWPGPGGPITNPQGEPWYPADFLRDVLPIPCHSHNDYWRKVPLFSALHAGCIGVEADVFEVGLTDLLVSHTRASLNPNRSLESLYIDPLVDILTRANAPSLVNVSSSSSSPDDDTTKKPRGVFHREPDQTLILLVDVKMNGTSTLEKVMAKLEPLRSRGWLTTFQDGVITEGPITVVVSGNSRFDVVQRNTTYRDIFFDAPLQYLDTLEYNQTNSYYASVKLSAGVGHVWFGGLRKSQRRRVQEQLQEAHRRGLKARYWGLPAWPVSFRNRVWDELVGQGLDMLNVDDLTGASKRDWSADTWI